MQVNLYMENKLSKFITGFRKLRRTQHFLVTMLEKWKNALDKNIFAFYFQTCQKPLIQST